jgi:hypothetical protein
MPNWCDNQVSITGPNSVINKIEKIVKEEKDSGGLLNFMFPRPTELDDTTSPAPRETKADKLKSKSLIEKYGHDNWYDWSCDNWGTKWDINEFYGVDRQGDTISFSFSSAWSPPIGAYETFIMNMSEQKQDVSVKAYYYEGGCDFMGCWDNGDDECIAPSDYKSTDDFWNDGIGAELDDMFNITESMAEYEAEQEAEKEDVHEYVKGKAINIGEEA